MSAFSSCLGSNKLPKMLITFFIGNQDKPKNLKNLIYIRFQLTSHKLPVIGEPDRENKNCFQIFANILFWKSFMWQ